MKENKKLLYYIIGIFLLISIVVGTTYAYFSASASNKNDISGSTAEIKLDLRVDKISNVGEKGENLIPIYDGTINNHDSLLATAAEVAHNCVDNNNYTVCQIYEITIINNGSNSTPVNVYISFNKGTVNNLKWSSMSGPNTVLSNSTHNITNDVDDVIESNVVLPANSSNTKKYFMVYINNLDEDQLAQDINSFHGTITVQSAYGKTVTATFK